MHIFHCRAIRFTIDNNQGFWHDNDLYSIAIPNNAVDSKVTLTVKTTSNVQMNPCSFGEVLISDIVEFEMTGVKFKNPASLAIKHSVYKLPDNSSIVIKAYQCFDDTWIALTADMSMLCSILF